MKYKKDENFSEWFQELIKESELVDDRYNIKGFIVYRERCAKTLRKMYDTYHNVLDRKSHAPLFMPVLIPEENFYKESEHVEGFTPEVFWATEHGSGEKLDQKLALRPTSETAFHQMYSLWIRSYKDLPFKRYQSGSVYRYESKATRPFFRGREFYWIETHCAFRDEKSARAQVEEDFKTTKEVLLDKLGMPHIFFRRPEWDKFAGAVDTYAADALMPSGKLLQLPSTHYLGTKFAKAFDVKYKDETGKEEYTHLTCYGPAITRIYGGMIAVHSDDKGLRVPFEIAGEQIVIVPIIFKGKDNEKVLKNATEIKQGLEGKYCIILDDSTDKTPGAKFAEYELNGVPIRIEIGPRDIESGKATIFRRDTNEKTQVPIDKIKDEIEKIETEFTYNLKAQAEELFKENIVFAQTTEQIRKVIDDGKIAQVPFCSRDANGESCADILRDNTKGGEVRGTKMNESVKPTGRCPICSKEAKTIVYVGKSY